MGIAIPIEPGIQPNVKKNVARVDPIGDNELMNNVIKIEKVNHYRAAI